MIVVNPIIDIKNNIEEILNKIKILNDMYDTETGKMNKVSYLYKNIKTGDMFSYNEDKLFYAASSIKILVCLYILENNYDLDKKILITMDDLKQDTGVIKFQKEDTYYTLRELIRVCIVESDNTAYIKLMNLVGKDTIEKYGKSMGALHTMEGKDLFGLINSLDMLTYWEYIYKFLNSDNSNVEFFKEILLNPSFKIISDESIDNKNYYRKYGSWDIAFHECGIVNDEYYLIVLTQLNKMDYKNEFVNKTASLIEDINNIILENNN